MNNKKYASLGTVTKLFLIILAIPVGLILGLIDVAMTKKW